MSMKYRYKQMPGCVDCEKGLPGRLPGECCPGCGGTFLGGQIILDYVVKEVWVPVRRRYWKPTTWLGGHWQAEGGIV